MTCQLEPMLDGYADSMALRLTRLAHGDKEKAQDSLWLAMQGDPILRRAVERAGVQKLIASGLARYRVLMKTGGAYLAAHPEKAEQLPKLKAVKE